MMRRQWLVHIHIHSIGVIKTWGGINEKMILPQMGTEKERERDEQ